MTDPGKLEDWRTRHPWWDLGEGWRVHVGLDEAFGRCWNKYTGEVTDWTTLRLKLYPQTPEGWERLVTDALTHE
jgi:hypothetical protein